MSFLKDLSKKANELKEKTQDRIKANGGLEGILQKTSEKVDKFTEAAGEGIKKATNETKQYIQEAKDTAQKKGEEGFIGVAKTLGSKVGTDVSSLVRTGYDKIASSESIQSLKRELQEAEKQHNAEHPEAPVADFSKITIAHIFTVFFSGVQNGNEWTTGSQPNNPKNERLIKMSYIVNDQEWFNKETQESGVGAFDLTLDFLSNQTGLSLLDKESASELVNKTQVMMTKLVEQLKAEEDQAKANVVKKTAAKKDESVQVKVDEEVKPVVKPVAVKKAPAPKKTVATKTTGTTAAKKVVAKTPAKTTTPKTPAVKKPAAKKVVNKKTPSTPTEKSKD